MAYADLMTKLKASREKVTKLNRTLEESTSKIKSQIAEEETSQGQLMTEIQAALSEELGQEVQIGGGRKPTKRHTEVTPTTPGNYDKEKVLARITTLKAEKKSWEVIAETLNAEGLKPKTAEQFAGPAVYQLFTAHQKASKKVVAATAANGAVKDAGERSPTLFK